MRKCIINDIKFAAKLDYDATILKIKFKKKALLSRHDYIKNE